MNVGDWGRTESIGVSNGEESVVAAHKVESRLLSDYEDRTRRIRCTMLHSAGQLRDYYQRLQPSR